MELEGKVAVVTGGTRGIGRGIALGLAANGADVALNYRKSADLARELAETIRGRGRRALAVQVDVSSFDDAQAMVQQVLDEFGRVDILVNNAGVNWDGVVWKMTEEQWDRVIDVDLGHVQLHAGRHSHLPPAGLRQDRQHHVHQRPARQVRPDQLLGGQGRGDRVYQGLCSRVGAV